MEISAVDERAGRIHQVLLARLAGNSARCAYKLRSETAKKHHMRKSTLSDLYDTFLDQGGGGSEVGGVWPSNPSSNLPLLDADTAFA